MPTDDGFVFDKKLDAAINNARLFSIVVGSISALFPLSVVMILFQRYTSLVRGKSMVHYVMMIAIADTATAITIAFGFPGPGPLCTAQGFLNFFFSRMSWFFTDVLIFQLFYIVVFKKYFLNVRYMHYIVWFVNILLQLLPFTTGTRYGFDDGADDSERFVINNLACGLGPGKSSYTLSLTWSQYVFNIELLISFFVIVILSATVVFYCLRMKSITTSHLYLAQRIRESWSIMILYPCAMIIAWVPGTIYAYHANYLINSGKELTYDNFVIANYLNAINALYGPFLTLIFYTKTLDARRAWILNFRQLYNFITNSKVDEDEVEIRISCTSIISIHDIEVATNTSITSINPISSDLTRIDDL